MRSPGVYRCFGADGALLYVGCSEFLFTRLAAHQIESGWWDDVRSVSFAPCASRAEALREEMHAIVTERPRENSATVGLGGWPNVKKGCVGIGTAARVLGVTKAQVREWCRSGGIEAELQPYGREEWYIPESELLAWIDADLRNQVKAPGN